MGRHTARTDLGREFGATDVVAERGDDGIQKVRDRTGGDGTHVVIEAVGHMPAYEQAVGIVRPGGAISRVGVPQYDNAPVGFGSLFGPNVTLTGAPAPARAYIQTLMPGILATRSTPAPSSTANSPSTRFRRDTRKWTADRPSRFSFVPDERSGGLSRQIRPLRRRHRRSR